MTDLANSLPADFIWGAATASYQIEGAAVSAQDDATVRTELLKIIEPISGEVNITKVEPVRDGAGRVLTYKVWVKKE